MENKPHKASTSIARSKGTKPDFYQSVAELLQAAKKNTYRAINYTMVETYWNVGRMIVEEEQRGQERAGYGTELIKNLSIRLTTEFRKGFSESSLWNMRQFYRCFPILSALRRELSWTHYKVLIRVENTTARNWYMEETAIQNWGTRALERQVASLYYERLVLSSDKADKADKAKVITEMQQKTTALAPTPQDLIKDPYILEFLGIPDTHKFREAELEEAIIGKLQAFMLELGRGFAFVGRQHRISTETKDFYIDLVFYNHILKCFVLIDLKTGELMHQDIGQMDMYVRLFEGTIKGNDDNPTVGLILCAKKDQTIVKYSVLEESKQLFAARYQLYLPSEEELQAEIARERELVVKERWGSYSVQRPTQTLSLYL